MLMVSLFHFEVPVGKDHGSDLGTQIPSSYWALYPHDSTVHCLICQHVSGDSKCLLSYIISGVYFVSRTVSKPMIFTPELLFDNVRILLTAAICLSLKFCIAMKSATG